jgi:mRNA-degrading endonuclease RelE of RelBE toxin-antitoxin system
MDFKVIVNEDAYLDLLDAIEYYEAKSSRLGERFFKIYKERIKELEKNPFYYGYHLDDFRRINFANFPYMMIYKILENNIVIVHEITFEGRSPETISRKLKSR